MGKLVSEPGSEALAFKVQNAPEPGAGSNLLGIVLTVLLLLGAVIITISAFQIHAVSS